MSEQLIKNYIDDEKTLFEKAQHGDIASRNILVEKNLGLCHKVAREFHKSFEHDEAVNILAIYLIRAIETFKTDANINFSTYAYVILRRRLLEIIRNSAKREVETSLDAMLGERDEDNKLQFEKILNSGEHIDDNLCKKEKVHNFEMAVRSAKESSSARDYKIFKSYYGIGCEAGKSTRQVAHEFEVSQCVVINALKKIRENIKEEFLKLGLNAENVL